MQVTSDMDERISTVTIIPDRDCSLLVKVDGARGPYGYITNRQVSAKRKEPVRVHARGNKVLTQGSEPKPAWVRSLERMEAAEIRHKRNLARQRHLSKLAMRS